jgi:DNA-binding NarL/FixJ family response regulator
MENARILVVDDDENFTLFFTEILKRHFSEVFCARDGAEGLRLAVRHRPDVILLDQQVAMKRHAMAKREWISMPKESWPTEQTYVQEIQPRLLDFKIVKIASTLGISEPYAAEIRDGRSRPHPRHWKAFAELAGV